MQAAHNVELGDRLGVSRSRRLEGLFKRHGVSARSILLAPKRAQPARCYTDVRGINMAIDIEVRRVAMHPLAYPVGQPAHGQDVARSIKSQRISVGEPLSG